MWPPFWSCLRTTRTGCVPIAVPHGCFFASKIRRSVHLDQNGELVLPWSRPPPAPQIGRIALHRPHGLLCRALRGAARRNCRADAHPDGRPQDRLAAPCRTGPEHRRRRPPGRRERRDPDAVRVRRGPRASTPGRRRRGPVRTAKGLRPGPAGSLRAGRRARSAWVAGRPTAPVAIPAQVALPRAA